MTRLRILSDLHLEFENHFKKQMTYPDGDANEICIIAGDIATWRHKNLASEYITKLSNQFKAVIFVMGNHDYYDAPNMPDVNEYYSWFAKAFDNVHFLQNDEVTIDGQRFIGATLWTDFVYVGEHFNSEVRLNDFYKLADASNIIVDKKLIKPDHILKLHNESKDYLFGNMDKDTVVITHHAPSYQGMHPKWKPKAPGENTINHLFYSNYDHLIVEKMPKLWISGHTHDFFDTALGTTRMVCNPRGYVSGYGSENVDYDWNFTVSI